MHEGVLQSFDLHQLQVDFAVHNKTAEEISTARLALQFGASALNEGAEMKIVPIIVSMSALAIAFPALAEGDLSRADVTEIAIEMGAVNPKVMYFKPDHIELETGKAYKLVFTNTDKVKHEFDAGEMASKVFTRKVEVLDKDGEMLAEIKGNVREIEVAGGGVAEWFVVPVQTGTNILVECALEGHKEAGMVGTVTIK